MLCMTSAQINGLIDSASLYKNLFLNGPINETRDGGKCGTRKNTFRLINTNKLTPNVLKIK